MRKVTGLIADQVVENVDGVDAAAIRANADRYAKQLTDLTTWMEKSFGRVPTDRRALVTNHHVFGYLADRFGFRVIGAVIPSGTTLASPSSSDLRSLTEAMEKAGVRTVFADSSQPKRLAEVLRTEMGGGVRVVELYSESLTAEGEGADTYLRMMRANTTAMVTGLTATDPPSLPAHRPSGADMSYPMPPPRGTERNTLMNKSIRGRALMGAALALAVSTVLTACGGEGSSSTATKSERTASGTPAVTVKDPVVATFDGSLYILDGESLKLARTIALPGFNRLNPAGDKDHVVVSTDSGFRVLDATGQTLTDIEYNGAKPGHVVRHAGKTVLFTDGTGEVNVFDPAEPSSVEKPQGRTYTSAEPYHGVAIERPTANS